MNTAIRNSTNWTSSNTTVSINSDNISVVRLHGNHIATITNDRVILFDGGWQSNTTKSRLNAILHAMAPTVLVFSKRIGSGSL